MRSSILRYALLCCLLGGPSAAHATALLYVQAQYTGAATLQEAVDCPSFACTVTKTVTSTLGSATGTTSLGASGLSISNDIARTPAGTVSNIGRVSNSMAETFTLSGPDTSLFLVDGALGFVLDGSIQVPLGSAYAVGSADLSIVITQGDILVDLDSSVVVWTDGTVTGNGLLFDLATTSPGLASWNNAGFFVDVPGLATNTSASVDIDFRSELYGLGTRVDFGSTFSTDPLAPFVVRQGPPGDYLLGTSAGDESGGRLSMFGSLETQGTVLHPEVVIPEPSTLLLLGIGLGALAAGQRQGAAQARAAARQHL